MKQNRIQHKNLTLAEREMFSEEDYERGCYEVLIHGKYVRTHDPKYPPKKESGSYFRPDYVYQRKSLPEEQSTVPSQMANYATVILNEMLALDPKATNTLVETRVPCNKALEEHHSIAVTEDREVGLLGILNGIFGQDGHAFIGARFQKGKLISFNHKPVEEK